MKDETEIQIQKFKVGDKSAFDKLIVFHKDWVIKMILSMVHNKQDAEDISQDVFVKVYFSLKAFKGLSSFKTWLYRIIINNVNGYYRKLKLLSTFNFELSKVDYLHIYDDENILGQFDKEALRNAVISLKKVQRNVVMLRIYNNHSFKEIANLLNISINNAKVSFHQAKNNLIKKVQ